MDTVPNPPIVNQKIVSYGRYASHKTIVCIQVTGHALANRLLALGRPQRFEYNSKLPTDAEFRNLAFAQT